MWTLSFQKIRLPKAKAFNYFSHYYIINHFESLDVAVKGLAK